MKDRFFKLLTGLRKHLPLIIYLILLIASLILISNRGGAFSYVLFFTVLLYLPVAFLQVICTRFFLRLYQDVEGRLLNKNVSVPCQISINNAGLFPIGGIRLLKDNDISDYESDFMDTEYRLLGFETRKIDTRIVCHYAGGYDAGISHISVSDIFGLIRITYEIPAPLRVHVLPIVTDVAAEDINRLFEEITNGSSIHHLDRDEMYPGHETRKYREGDSYKAIHWKNYARTGHIQVRLPDKQDSGMMTIAIMPYEEATIKTKDYMLEYLVSVADWFVRHGNAVRVVYYCAGVKEYLIDGYNSFSIFYHEKLKDFGEVGKTYPEDTFERLQDVARQMDGPILIYNEETGKLING